MSKKRSILSLLAGFLICLLLLQSFVGCGIREMISGVIGENGALTDSAETTQNAGLDYDPEKYHISHPELICTYREEDGKRISEMLTELDAVTKAEKVSDDVFLSTYKKTEDAFYKLQQEYQIAYVEYCLFQNDSEKEQTYRTLVDDYTALLQPMMLLYRTVYESRYRDAFYDGWTEDEIEEALHMADHYSEEIADLQAKASKAAVDQENLEEKDYDAGSERIFRELLSINTEIAKAMGYSDYMHYAYDSIYSRDYAPEDISETLTWMQSELFPLLDVAEKRLKASGLNVAEQHQLKQIFNGTFEQDWNRELIEGYYKTLGGGIYDAYLAFMENGYYYIAYDEEASEEGAFTFYYAALGEPAIYFGPGYQDMFTFVHEFGHYYSMTIHGEDELSYDLCETQSQGDEWLFLAYLKSVLSENVFRYLKDYNFYLDALTVAVAMTVDRFEQMAYRSAAGIPESSGKFASIDVGTFDDLYREACSKVFGSYDTMKTFLGYPPEQYWRLVVIENPGYYVSYAVSLIPSMELYALACENFTNAAAVYEAVQRGEGTFCEVLQEAGILSPFTRNAYDLIQKTFR